MHSFANLDGHYIGFKGYFSKITKIGLMLSREVPSWLDMGGYGMIWQFSGFSNP